LKPECLIKNKNKIGNEISIQGFTKLKKKDASIRLKIKKKKREEKSKS
jgi:hypothetical protein